jgi:hypothetical protein
MKNAIRWTLPAIVVILALTELVNTGPAKADQPAAPEALTTATPTANPSSANQMLVAGNVWLHGLGTYETVEAFVGLTECGSAQPIQIIDAYDTSYSISIAGAVKKNGCAEDGSVVTFTVGGVKADQTVVWHEKAYARLNLVAGGSFDRIGGSVTSPNLSGALAVEPLIGDVLCGYQLNAFQGEGPEWGFDVVVFSDQIYPGCGHPGAEITLRIVDKDSNANVTKVLAMAEETIPWQIWDPDQTNARPVDVHFNFLNAPTPQPAPTGTPKLLVAPVTGSAGSHHDPSPLIVVMPIVASIVLLFGIGLSRRLKAR